LRNPTTKARAMPDRNSTKIRELLEAGLRWADKDQDTLTSQEEQERAQDVEQARYILEGWREREEAEAHG
jgi:hypothetical protein